MTHSLLVLLVGASLMAKAGGQSQSVRGVRLDKTNQQLLVRNQGRQLTMDARSVRIYRVRLFAAAP